LGKKVSAQKSTPDSPVAASIVSFLNIYLYAMAIYDFIVSSKLGANFTHSLQGFCLLIYH